MTRKINSLRSFTGKHWGARGHNFVNIYKAWALPNISFGSLTFLPISNTHINKIQVLQNGMVRSAFRLPKDTPIPTLHTTSQLLPITEHLLEHAVKVYKRINQNEIVKYSVTKYKQIDHHTEHPCPMDLVKSVIAI
jgi:hypothetical protein